MTTISQTLLHTFSTYYQQAVHSHLENFPLLSTMLGYQMGWNDTDGNLQETSGGKQIRPLLALLSCAAMGADHHRTLGLAAAIELIHTFSLIHDDVMDNSDMRRGRPSVWKVWGINQAINAGDGAYGLSFELLADPPLPGIDAQLLLRAEAMLGRVCVDTVQGQMMDIAFEDRQFVAVDEYVMMTGLKTGPLIGLALGGGALLAGCDPATIAALDNIGRALGVAFQMQDDILGVWGDPTQTGKSSSDDIVQKKKSLPVLWALENLQGADRVELVELYHHEAPLPLKAVARVQQLITESGAREAVEAQAKAYYQQVIDGIDSLYPDNDHRSELSDIVAFIVNRAR